MFEKFLPTDKKEVVVIHPTDQYPPFYLGQGSTIAILPYHDADGKVNEAAAKKLNSIKVTGWDYLPEKLDWPTVHGWDRFLSLWFSTRYMYPNEVIEELKKEGFKVKEMQCGLDDLKLLLTKKEEFKVQELTPYERTRVLWALHHDKFNEWEAKFVESIGKQLRDGRPLTSKQDLYLTRTFKKYKVTGAREQIAKVNKLMQKKKATESAE